MDLSLFLQLGLGGAAMAVLVLVVQRVSNHNEKMLDKVLHFFGNHMSENVKTQVRVAETLDELAAAVRALKDEVKGMHKHP